jgi:hypothetical protein
MGLHDREKEVKLRVVTQAGLVQVAGYLQTLLGDEVEETRMGTSRDTYWPAPPGARADFFRVRERDGIRQVTVKGRDRGDNADRMEVDLDCTSPTFRIHKLARALLGKPAGTIDKTYWVFELESEHDTVCVYETRGVLFVECEAKSGERVDELVGLVSRGLKRAGLAVELAAGSLYEMYIQGEPTGSRQAT